MESSERGSGAGEWGGRAPLVEPSNAPLCVWEFNLRRGDFFVTSCMLKPEWPVLPLTSAVWTVASFTCTWFILSARVTSLG